MGISGEMWAIIISLAGALIGYAIRMERLMTKLVFQNQQSNEQHARSEKDIKLLDSRVDDHETRITVIESNKPCSEG